ncbi:MAG: hypothetical protein ACXADX_04250 [Candidatus Hodarchaeales archaeon]|jgi:hypothetical protein
MANLYAFQAEETLEISRQRRNWYLQTLSKAQIYKILQNLRKQGFDLGPTSKLNKDQLRYLLLEVEFGQHNSDRKTAIAHE